MRGILRRTTLADYLTSEPHWQTLIDYDALAKQDKQEWVANGLTCLYPGNSLCLVSLSAGGEDARDPARIRPENRQVCRAWLSGCRTPNKPSTGWIKTRCWWRGTGVRAR